MPSAKIASQRNPEACTNVACPTIRLRRSSDWMAFCRRRIWSSLAAVARPQPTALLSPLGLCRHRPSPPYACEHAYERCNPLSSVRSPLQRLLSRISCGDCRWWLLCNHLLNAALVSSFYKFNHFTTDVNADQNTSNNQPQFSLLYFLFCAENLKIKHLLLLLLNYNKEETFTCILLFRLLYDFNKSINRILKKSIN